MRSGAFVARPSFTVEERIEQIVRQEVRLIIEPLGPSKFRVKPMDTKGAFMVGIGSQQTCSCRDSELCIHILYVMMRYFDVPRENDILWQTALTEREIDVILDGRVKRRPVPRKQPVYTTKSGKRKVKRHPIGPEDVCPICYDSFSECDKCKIAWCRLGCGGNFHRKCVKAWIESRRSHGDQPTCPICREPLDMLGVKAPPKKPIDAPPALSPAEIRELQMREICPDDYHLLLRLDDIAHPRVQNQRIRAGNQIIAHSPFELTRGIHSEHQRQKIAQPPRRPAPMRDFVAEITGIGIALPRQQPRASDDIHPRGRPGVPARIERPRIARSRTDADERGLLVRPF
jgi:hypothetical protein